MTMRVKDLTTFIGKREELRLNKEANAPWPWTDDSILAQYRFCNVNRENDAVTKWIAENWRTPHKDDPDLWFAMVVARLFNLPESLKAIGYPVPWKPNPVARVLSKRSSEGQKNFNGAYIVSTNGLAMDKVQYLIQHVLNPLWAKRKVIRPTHYETLDGWHSLLCQFNGLGSFMVAQVVADMKYVDPLRQADDWMTFAASGPGSRRGLNRVCGKPVDSPWREPVWRATLGMLQEAVNATLPAGLEDLHAQDLQNCLCEFDKYERARLGEGTPKQLYKRGKQ